MMSTPDRKKRPQVQSRKSRSALGCRGLGADGQSLGLTPVRNAKQEQKFEKALATVHKRFGRAMKRLAE